MAPETVALVLGAMGRGVAYGAGLLIIGVAAFAERVAGPSPNSRSIGPASTLAARAALVLMAAHVWRLYAQTYYVFGIEESVTFEYLRIVAFQTGWGTGWLAQLAIATGAFVVLFRVRRPSRARGARLGVAVAVALSFTFTGHTLSQGGSVALNVAVQTVHVAAAGTWLGALTVLLWRRRDAGPEVFADWVSRFSPMAVGAVAALLLSGTLTTIVYLQPLSALWTSAYGWTLLAKVALVLAVGAAGAYNWRVLKPRLRKAGAAATLTRTASLELTIGTVVLGVTAFLSALSP